MVLLTQNPAVLSGTVDGQHVLFNLGDRQLHVLNQTGAAAWDGLRNPTTTEALASALATDFGVAVADVRSGLDELLVTFSETGLCQSVDATAGAQERDSFPYEQLSSPQADSVFEGAVVEVAPGTHRPRAHLGPFSALSIPVILTVDDPELASELDQILDPLRCNLDALDGAGAVVEINISAPSRGPAHHGAQGEMWSVDVSGKSTLRFSTRERVIRQVVAEVNSGPLRHLDDAVVFHSGAAEFAAGVVLFPGVSNAGKSTLITQLVSRGHGYVTDEAAMVRVGGTSVEAFPKSITLEPGSQRVVRDLVTDLEAGAVTVDVDPRRIASASLSAGGPVVAMIFPTFRQSTNQETVRTSLTALTPFETFRSLLANAFAFDRVGQAAFDTMIELANTIPAFCLEHSGAPDHLTVIEETVSQIEKRNAQLTSPE